MAERPTIYTVGHSNGPFEGFVALLRRHELQAIVDVRSSPYNRYATQYDREALAAGLEAAGVRYVYLGDALGGRPENPGFYDADGRVRYDLLAATPRFQGGIEKVERGAERYRLALACAEEDPRGCHRRLLIGRVLTERGWPIAHLRGDGRVETEAELARAEAMPHGQLSLFDDEERPWTSTRSATGRSRRKPSSDS